MSEEQALVYVDTVKAILVAAEKVEEEQEIREMLLQEKWKKRDFWGFKCNFRILQRLINLKSKYCVCNLQK